jgi:hypothetical protein
MQENGHMTGVTFHVLLETQDANTLTRTAAGLGYVTATASVEEQLHDLLCPIFRAVTDEAIRRAKVGHPFAEEWHIFWGKLGSRMTAELAGPGRVEAHNTIDTGDIDKRPHDVSLYWTSEQVEELAEWIRRQRDDVPGMDDLTLVGLWMQEAVTTSLIVISLHHHCQVAHLIPKCDADVRG